MAYKTLKVLAPDTDPKANYFLWRLDGTLPQVLQVYGATITEADGVYSLEFTYRGEPLCVRVTTQEAHEYPAPTVGRIDRTVRVWTDSDFRLNGGF